MVGIAYPDTDNNFWRVANRPVIVVIGGGSGFDCSWPVDIQGRVGTEPNRTGVVVVENIGDQPGNTFIDNPDRCLVFMLVDVPEPV